MAQNGTYNGWPNYETWNVMLWMDNEEPAYRYYRARVESVRQAGKRLGGVGAKAIVKACFGEATPDGVNLESSKIRWGAIAEAMREDAWHARKPKHEPSSRIFCSRNRHSMPGVDRSASEHRPGMRLTCSAGMGGPMPASRRRSVTVQA